MTELFDFLEMFNSSLKVKTNSTSQNKPYYLGSSIYIVDSLRIYDLSIDDQSSMLASSIYTVTLFGGGPPCPRATSATLVIS